MIVVPLTLKAACAFIAAHHRHHPPPQGCKFAIGVEVAGKLVAVATCGRPVARMLDDGRTAEVTRLCSDGTPNACSFLYQRVRRVAQAMGYAKVITYILDSETGGSLRGAGFEKTADSGGGSWSRPSRGREQKAPTARKQRFESTLFEVA